MALTALGKSPALNVTGPFSTRHMITYFKWSIPYAVLVLPVSAGAYVPLRRAYRNITFSSDFHSSTRSVKAIPRVAGEPKLGYEDIGQDARAMNAIGNLPVEVEIGDDGFMLALTVAVMMG